MENEISQPMVGMVGCDRELFARVWARVEPNPGDACPIQVLPPDPPAFPAVPAPTAPSAADSPGEDAPQPGDVPCLGLAGADHGTLLQQRIGQALVNWRVYQALSARAPGRDARVLAALAADERRHAKRLAGAYFLITGVRLTPQLPPRPRDRGDFWGELRRCFWWEQRSALLYAAAAEETADQCLAALYRELSAEESAHADQLRALAERM